MIIWLLVNLSKLSFMILSKYKFASSKSNYIYQYIIWANIYILGREETSWFGVLEKIIKI